MGSIYTHTSFYIGKRKEIETKKKKNVAHMFLKKVLIKSLFRQLHLTRDLDSDEIKAFVLFLMLPL